MSTRQYGHLSGAIVDAGVLTVNQKPIAAVAMSGSASDIQTGVLPVAQVPNLDASKITTGTMALARLPPSASNVFTGYNTLAVSGTSAFPIASGGTFLSHNRDGASGLACIANAPVAGSGGFEFVSYSPAGAFQGVSASLTPSGTLTVSSLNVGPSVVTSTGSMFLAGTLNLAQGSATGGSQVLMSSTGGGQTHRIATRHYATAAAGNAVDTYLWTYGVDGTSPGSTLGLSVTPSGVGLNGTPNPRYGLDCNGSGCFNGMVRGLGSGLLMRVFDESNTAFPSSGALPEVFRGRPVDTQILQAITFPVASGGGGMTAGYTQNYSCRVTGYVLAPATDTYVFQVYADDGVRMWINNARVLDAWQVQSATVTSATVALGSAWVPFVLEYVQAGYASGLTVQWRGASTNTSFTPFAAGGTGSAFRFACDMYENPGTQLGTCRVNGKAMFLGNAGFGGQTAPRVAVDVVGAVQTTADSLLNGMQVGNWGSVGKAALGYGAGTLAGTDFALAQDGTGSTLLNSKAGAAVAFSTGAGAVGMTFTSAQLRVGDSATPTATLDVAGGCRVAAGQSAVTVGSSSGATTSVTVQASSTVLEAGVASVGSALGTGSLAGDAVVRASSSSGTQRLLLRTGGSGQPGLTVDGSNRVGVGTSSPAYALDVAGTGHVASSLQLDGIGFMNNQGTTCMLALNSSTGSVPTSTSTTFHGFGMQPGVLRYQVPTTGADSHVFYGATTQLMSLAGGGVTVSVPLSVTANSVLSTAQATTMRFLNTNTLMTGGPGGSSANDYLQVNGGSGTTGLVVNYNSQVGIGTTAPKYALDVVGSARVQTSGAPAAYYSAANGQTANFWYTGSDQSNNYVVYNQANTGVYLANGASSWSSNSDRRLKSGVRAVEGALRAVMALRPVSFDWKGVEAGTPRNLGLIAQEAAEVLPDIVTGPPEGYLGLKYTELIPVLIAAVQELCKEVRAGR